MAKYPQESIELYLRASNKLKKFDRIVFKRFAPNVSEVLDEFVHLALTFEEECIFQYAAMCYLGVAKCETSAGNVINECNSYVKGARNFQNLHIMSQLAHIRSNCNWNDYKSGALKCYMEALEHCADEIVIKAALIREMSPLQQYHNVNSSFSSPAHRIYELELGAHFSLRKNDFLTALQQLDDVVDYITERKKEYLYQSLLQRVEIQRLLLLIGLHLPPARQSPSHIKLIEFYLNLCNYDCDDDISTDISEVNMPISVRYALADIVISWAESSVDNLRCALQYFLKSQTLNQAHIYTIHVICRNLKRQGHVYL